MVEPMRNLSDHIVFAGGGTAGHLFPGLAVAEFLRRHAPALRFTFAGTGKAFEKRHVAQAGFDYVTLPARPFPRKASEAIPFLTENFHGYRAARRLLRERQTSLVVGLGGYASVPTVRAATAAGIASVLLEQNTVPGRATRWLAPTAELVCASFDSVRDHLRHGCHVRVTGNPLRRAFTGQQTPARVMPDRLGTQRTLVVLGGSGGAQTLNEQVPRALYKAGLALAGWRVVHQSGERDCSRTSDLYRKLAINATVVPFIENMPTLLRSSHLAVSRSGGTTLAELAASGVPAIVLPYPHATDDHQRKNADAYCAAGATRLVDEREVEGRLDNHLASTLIEMLNNHALRVRMAHAMTRLARPEATRRVAKSIAVLLSRRQPVAV